MVHRHHIAGAQVTHEMTPHPLNEPRPIHGAPGSNHVFIGLNVTPESGRPRPRAVRAFLLEFLAQKSGGMPRGRVPPFSFSISTSRMGGGKYEPDDM